MASKRNRPNNSPPAKDGKKKKDSEILYPCVTCGKEVESECIECECATAGNIRIVLVYLMMYIRPLMVLLLM